MRTRVKICGMTRKQDIDFAIAAGVDVLGFIFYKLSKRYISAANVAAMLHNIPPFVGVAGVFVNPSFEELKSICSKVPLTLLQFHGDETYDYCQFCANEMKLPWIKVIRVSENSNCKEIANSTEKYSGANAILFDTDSEHFGGVGRSFNWNCLPINRSYPLILSGGINLANVADAVSKIHPYGIDVCSGVEFENQPGMKDHLKIAELLELVYLADQKKNKRDAGSLAKF